MMTKIPKQLQREELKFILLKKKEKIPIELNWQKEANYKFNNPKLLKHLKAGGNYGVICGNGLIIVDADLKIIDNMIKDNFPKTFTVKTKNGKHYYFYCVGFDNKKVLKDKGTHFGEILSKGSFAVGGNSIHPSGIKYNVENDIDISTVEKKDIDNVFEGYYASDKIGKEVILDGAGEGLRNESMFKLACSFRNQGLTAKETLKALEGINKNNKPPLPDRELNILIKSAFSYEREKDSNDGKNILELLEEPEVFPKYIDLGEAKDKWFFGFNLGNKEAIITSEGKILRNTEEKFKDKTIGENQIKKLLEKYEGYIGDIAPTIARQTVKKFYTKISRNHLVNPKEIYKVVRDKILYYLDFKGKDEIADVFTCWIMATYCYPLFYWFPHILINAPSGSGKSKCGKVVMYLSFRGFELNASGGITPAQIIRTIEGNRGTVFIDEYEKVEGLNSETLHLCNQIFNASAERDAYIIVNEQIEKTWKPKKFPIFCPKITCNISGINPTSLSRFIAFKWLKSKGEKSKRKPQRERDKHSFKQIVENLYFLILENWKKIKKNYEDLDLPQLTARTEDNWLPLFAVARFIDGCDGEDVNAEGQINKYLKDYKEIEIVTEDETEDFFRILLEKVTEDRWYTPKEIGGWSEILSLFSELKSPANKVGRILTLYKFKNNRSGGIKKYLLSKKNIKKVIELYFSIDITTQDNTNNTDTHKQHKTTQTDVVLSGGCVVTPEARVLEKKKDFQKQILSLTEFTTPVLMNYLKIKEKEDQDIVLKLLENLEHDGSIIKTKNKWAVV